MDSLSHLRAISQAKKLLHVGANTGQEAKTYHELGVRAWHVEAIPELYQELLCSIQGFDDQFALNKCLSAQPGQTVEFHIANNGGQSSSMLHLGRHSYAYPMVKYARTIALETCTIDELIRQGHVDSDVDFLLVDVQGAELMVLQGATELLARSVIKQAIVEVSVVPLYRDGASFLDVLNFLEGYGLYLRNVDFNEMGWGNALFQFKYWPTSPPANDPAIGLLNIAPLAHIEQSSALYVEGLSAMSGKEDGTFCFHTDREERPWILLSFGEPKEIVEIAIYNRCDAAQERAYPINVYTRAEDSADWELVHENHDPYGGVDWPGPLRIGLSSFTKQLLFRLRSCNYFHLDQIKLYARCDLPTLTSLSHV